jgi:glucose/mannose-6-phosphate isomerase
VSEGRASSPLDDGAAVAARDAHGVREVLAAFPAQCRQALALRVWPTPPAGAPGAIIVAGMGGSAAGGDLLAACADRVRVPVLVHRGYGLPAVIGDDTLVIASSYSGDTVETISAVEEARARGCQLVVVTTGGALGRLADRHGLPRIVLPAGLMPRMALGYLFFPLLTLLAGLGCPVATPDEVAEALEVLEGLSRTLEPTHPAPDNEAKRLAQGVGLRVPAIYGGPTTQAAVYRWATDFAENAKLFALPGVLPEMNHNLIEAWRGAGAREIPVLLLRDEGESPAIARRFAILRDLIEPRAGGIQEVWARGKGRLARLLSLAYLGQWTSYYLAVLRDVDPWPIPLLDAMKERLAR